MTLYVLSAIVAALFGPFLGKVIHTAAKEEEAPKWPVK